jgi:hypothetical protein
MKTLAHFLLLLAVCSLSGCLFKEPVFTEGFAKIDPALGGVWAADGKNGDPRQTEFAVCAPLDGDRYILQHPAGDKGSLLYEARLLHVRGRSLLQLRLLAGLTDGLATAGAERYTLVWIEKEAGRKLRIRALGSGVKGKGAAAVASSSKIRRAIGTNSSATR